MSAYAAHRNYISMAVLFFYLLCNAVLCTLYPFYIVFGVNLLLILSFVFSIKPAWGVYFLIFLVPVSRDSIYFAFTGVWNIQISNAYINLVPVFTPVFIFTCVGFMLHKGASLWVSAEVRNPAKVLFIPMAVYAAGTLLWSENLLHGLFQYYYLASNIVLLGIIVSTAANEQTHRKIMWCLALQQYYWQ